MHAAEWDAQRKGDGDQRRDAFRFSTRAANLKTLSEAAKPLYGKASPMLRKAASGACS